MGPKKQKAKDNPPQKQTESKEEADLKEYGTMRVEKCIAFTDIPVRHFYAMLKKDAIGWRRTWKRAMFEVLFPSIVVWLLVIIRLQVKVQKIESPYTLTNYITFIGPWSTPFHAGVTKKKGHIDGMYNEKLSNNDMHIGLSMKKDMDHLEDFHYFHNRTERERIGSNPAMQWIGDNCNKPTIYNNERMKWGVIGDLNNDDSILNDFSYSMANFF